MTAVPTFPTAGDPTTRPVADAGKLLADAMETAERMARAMGRAGRTLDGDLIADLAGDAVVRIMESGESHYSPAMMLRAIRAAEDHHPTLRDRKRAARAARSADAAVAHSEIGAAINGWRDLPASERVALAETFTAGSLTAERDRPASGTAWAAWCAAMRAAERGAPRQRVLAILADACAACAVTRNPVERADAILAARDEYPFAPITMRGIRHRESGGSVGDATRQHAGDALSDAARTVHADAFRDACAAVDREWSPTASAEAAAWGMVETFAAMLAENTGRDVTTADVLARFYLPGIVTRGGPGRPGVVRAHANVNMTALAERVGIRDDAGRRALSRACRAWAGEVSRRARAAMGPIRDAERIAASVDAVRSGADTRRYAAECRGERAALVAAFPTAGPILRVAILAAVAYSDRGITGTYRESLAASLPR